MIRFAKAADHPQLKTLWAEAFSDSPGAIDAYFIHRHADENMLVDERNGSITGMLNMLPLALTTNGGKPFSARYLYAIATRKAFRGQGISTALIACAHEQMKAMEIAASVLVPGDAGLFAFYAKRGYQTAFHLDIVSFDAEALPAFPPEGRHSPCLPGEYTRLRDLAFQSSSLYARWDEHAAAYAVQTFTQPGGVTALSWENGSGCAAWETAEDGILVKELALLQGDIDTALAVLHHALQAKHYTVRLAQGMVQSAAHRPFGMIHWLVPEPVLSGRPPYLSLAMD